MSEWFSPVIRARNKALASKRRLQRICELGVGDDDRVNVVAQTTALLVVSGWVCLVPNANWKSLTVVVRLEVTWPHTIAAVCDKPCFRTTVVRLKVIGPRIIAVIRTVPDIADCRDPIGRRWHCVFGRVGVRSHLRRRRKSFRGVCTQRESCNIAAGGRADFPVCGRHRGGYSLCADHRVLGCLNVHS